VARSEVAARGSMEIVSRTEEAVRMATDESGTEELLERASQNDASAFGRLCERHRARLRRLVAARLERRLAARVDPSDVVHEAFADAQKRLPEFLRARPVAFFPWLRNLALQRLIGAPVSSLVEQAQHPSRSLARTVAVWTSARRSVRGKRDESEWANDP
jgi:RNA polymerase sigma-70 factor, ECF subfamily